MIELIFGLAFIFVSSAEAKNITQQYISQLKEESSSLSEFKKDFTASYKKFCPDTPEADEALCMYTYFSAWPVKSSTDLVLRSTILVGEFVKKSKITSESVKLEMTDSVLSFLEKVDLGNFYVAKMKAASESDRVELAELKKLEVASLNDSIQKLCNSLSSGLSAFESSSSFRREPASNRKLNDLKRRLEIVKKRVWQ